MHLIIRMFNLWNIDIPHMDQFAYQIDSNYNPSSLLWDNLFKTYSRMNNLIVYQT